MRRHPFPGTHAALVRRAARLLLLVLPCAGPSACSSDPGEQPLDAPPAFAPVDASASPGDAGQRGDPLDVVHVPAAGAFAGTGRLILQDGAVIDTTSLTIGDLSYPDGPEATIVFDAWAQEPSGPELAVLHVEEFGIQSGTVTVRGTRPLVIIARGEIRLAGMLEASARDVQAGPGGWEAGTGPGAGGIGRHAGVFQDGGGGGGSHGSVGGAGGSGVCVDGVCASGGGAGIVAGTAELAVLEGGSGGGAGAIRTPTETCLPAPGGGGGGAVQLTALGRIRIEPGGGVHAGGGGGSGGALDSVCDDNGGGGGGGSGGAIFLQAPAVENRGVLAANGGGGGSGASGSHFPGQDALPADRPAPGGQQVNDVAFAGGCGAALVTDCTLDGDGGDANAGGGGGGVGRIVIVTDRDGYLQDDGLISPEAYFLENRDAPLPAGAR
jgi:hypothetical protein